MWFCVEVQGLFWFMPFGWGGDEVFDILAVAPS